LEGEEKEGAGRNPSGTGKSMKKNLYKKIVVFLYLLLYRENVIEV